MNLEPGEKKVDESWKEQVEKERQAPVSEPPKPAQPQRQEPPPVSSARQQPQPSRRGAAPPQSDFAMFLSSLSMQAMIALGEMAHPATGLAQPDMEQSRYLVDVLGLLQEKTQGNLSPEETALLDGLLYELRMKYVEKTQGGLAR
ncbi:MAG: DUF1844 domain-containing protein [Candidatus Omnitrophota bacterium]|nr:DUF1844 domain-containing protein [Candidatus Omnitrophota bacterium]